MKGIAPSLLAVSGGYTLLVASGANLTVNPALHGSKLPFDVERDFIAPRGTPPAVVAKISTTLAEALETPAVREKLLAQGVEPVGGTPQEFRAFLKAEMGQWGKVMREAGIRVE